MCEPQREELASKCGYISNAILASMIESQPAFTKMLSESEWLASYFFNRLGTTIASYNNAPLDAQEAIRSALNDS